MSAKRCNICRHKIKAGEQYLDSKADGVRHKDCIYKQQIAEQKELIRSLQEALREADKRIIDLVGELLKTTTK